MTPLSAANVVVEHGGAGRPARVAVQSVSKHKEG
jgi:hypothetical protein